MIRPALRRRTSRLPRSDRIEGQRSTSAARVTRAVTAAAGVQPAFRSERANDPNVPKVAEERRARARPVLRWRVEAAEVMISNLSLVKVRYAHDYTNSE